MSASASSDKICKFADISRSVPENVEFKQSFAINASSFMEQYISIHKNASYVNNSSSSLECSRLAKVGFFFNVVAENVIF